jgi:hypothetical protein
MRRLRRLGLIGGQAAVGARWIVQRFSGLACTVMTAGSKAWRMPLAPPVVQPLAHHLRISRSRPV